MLTQKVSADGVMAILWSPGPHDETLHYLLILCSKVTLDALVLSFFMRSIHRSLLGLCSVTMFAADSLLVAAVAYVWLFQEHLATSMCFILAHASAVYAFLPLPLLMAGAVDYATQPSLDAGRSSRRRVATHCGAAALLWGSACVYSSHTTDTQPVEIYTGEDVKILACRVHGSTIVFYFSVEISAAVGFILLLHWKKLIGWIRRANQRAEKMSRAFDLEKDQSLSNSQDEEGEDGEEHGPPLAAGLTLGFAMSWMPYLCICVACGLLNLVVPAYASVNLLWMACVNSVLAGFACWYKSNSSEPFSRCPDDMCLWSLYWPFSQEITATGNDVNLSKGLCVTVHKTSAPLQNTQSKPFLV